MPPARLWVPSNAPTVPHMSSLVTRSGTVAIRNIVVPYMSIRSPGFCASTLTASDQASIVPVMTGTPARIPAISRPVTPARSPGQRSAGRSRPGATCSAQGRYQSSARVSYSGVHWLAEWWSRTYSPVSRCTPLYDTRALDWYRPWAEHVAPGLDLPALARRAGGCDRARDGRDPGGRARHHGHDRRLIRGGQRRRAEPR